MKLNLSLIFLSLFAMTGSMADPTVSEPETEEAIEQSVEEIRLIAPKEETSSVLVLPGSQVTREEPQINLIQELLDRNVITEESLNNQSNRVNSTTRSGGMGNGGDAVICPEKIEMLDSYEAGKLRFNINLNPENLEAPTWRSMVNVAVQRLERFDEVLATKLYDYSMEMVNDFEKFELYPNARGQHVYLGRDVIIEIDDSAHVSLPEGCILRQFISQRAPRFRRDFRYEFSLSIWELMDKQEQAMAILHEAWYRIMLENGATDSVAARYMNGLVASEFFDSYTFIDYIEEIKETELKEYIVPNTSEAIKQSEIKLDLKEHIYRAEDGMICAPNFKVQASIKKPYNLRAIIRGQDYVTNIQFQDVCFKDSRLRKVVLPVAMVQRERILRLPFAQVYFDEALSETPAMHFNEEGKLSHLTDIRASHLYRMYYECDGARSFDRMAGCESGPYNDRDSVIQNTSVIQFDGDEKLAF
ncbi:MAG: hypothetical protein CME65_15775 [Halobacteriovoraceae bacterium]|nr:hypothetical protein [Halobacteriovoraceae bacterium]